MEEILKPILQALGAVLATALVALVTQMLRKYNIQLSAEKQGQLEHFAKLGIGYAEELALRQAKAYSEKMLPEVKHAKALEYLMDKLPNVDLGEADKIITALLPDKRAAAGQVVAAVVEAGKAMATAEVRPAAAPGK